MTTLNDLNLNPDQDSFIIVRFTGKLSSQFELYPVNVSPVQMIMVGKVLELQGESTLTSEALRQAVRDVLKEKEQPDLLVAKGRILKP